MAKYVMVLWTPGLSTPDGGHVKGKDFEEPDLRKYGGEVVKSNDNQREILLPKAAAKQLRKHRSVIYLQRIWMGEALDDWEDGYEGSAGFKVETTDEHTNLAWVRAFSYDGSGNITQMGADHYTYDSAGRLIRAEVGGKVETYKYDSFGNLTEKAVEGANPVVMAVDGSSNRLIGPEYDAAGNVTTRNGQRAFDFDALNMAMREWRPELLGSRRILYDADDERLGTLNDNDHLSRWTIRDLSGQVIREFKGETYSAAGTWTWEQDQVYADGRLVSGETLLWSWGGGTSIYGGVRHYHLDHLGSVRLVTNAQGKSVAEHDYYPFGVSQTRSQQEQLNPGDPHIDSMRFAGHWRDFLGLASQENTHYVDYMHARYYDPNLGRFLSVDPVLGDPAAPQSWNRYSYARNSPLMFTDPTGEFVDLSALSNDERNKLIAGLNDFTGNTYGVDPNTNYLVLQSVGQNSSATATAFVDGLIGSSSAYNVVATTKPGESWYNAGQNRIEIDFGAFDGANYNGIDARSFNLGSTAIHEWKHQTTGLFDTPDGQRMTATPQDTSWTGPIVDAVNVMRAERGLATRAAYYSTPVRPPGFAGFFGIGQPRSALRFFDPQRGRVVQVIRNVP